MRAPYRFDWRMFLAFNAVFGVGLAVWVVIGAFEG